MSPQARFTPVELAVLRAIVLTCATISIVSALIASYFFCTMKKRKKFRHRLILLLILCNLCRALCYFTYPIVLMIHGPLRDGSSFCRINGFFLSLGTEATDFANLVIAVHTSIQVFSSTVSSHEGGLYPYRRKVYVVWALFALCMASLAFCNPKGDHAGYFIQGVACHLPLRPLWYRLALSWIPRYLIMVVIFCLYISIYSYINFKLKGIEREVLGPDHDIDMSTTGSKDFELSQFPATPSPGKGVSDDVPSLPELNYHGLVREDRRPSGVSSLFYSTSSEFDGSDVRDPDKPLPEDLQPEIVAARQMFLSLEESRRLSSSAAPGTDSDSDIGILHALIDGDVDDAFFPPKNRNSVVRAAFHGDREGIPALALRKKSLKSSHLKIRRQLRLLFVYPVAYFLTWLVPFVFQCLQYSDHYAQNPPVPLACASAAVLALQCAIDCWLFTTREKPWRKNSPCGEDRASYWINRWWNRLRARFHRRITPGRTRREMAVDAEWAHRRRNEELMEAINRKRTSNILLDKAHRRLYWWEEEGRMLEESLLRTHSGSALERDRVQSKSRGEWGEERVQREGRGQWDEDLEYG